MEALESRCLFYNSYPSIALQMRDWINRDRASPVVACARVNVDLNYENPPNYLAPTPKPALIWNEKLVSAASGWADWLLDHDIMTHGWGDSNPTTRVLAEDNRYFYIMENAGYITTPEYSDINLLSNVATRCPAEKSGCTLSGVFISIGVV